MTERTPAELREQRARLIASTGLTETVLRERAEAFQLYPEHHDIWATVEGIDYLLSDTPDEAPSPWPRPTVCVHDGAFSMATIHPDGRLTYGEGYEPDEAAQQFWAALQRWAPQTFRASQAEETLRMLAPMFEGLQRLLATSSRDWGEYRVDAWLWAVLLGWDCEEDVHGETCVHGTMAEMQQAHGWDDAAVAKARRYRSAVRAVEAFNGEAGR
ncbi:hypothetical protein [Streptomyces microflavus]|uniref:hypothetical protein n=1 Tax=Streptomyces microflavus TaxID=1919 RepID=UPI0033C403DF